MPAFPMSMSQPFPAYGAHQNIVSVPLYYGYGGYPRIQTNVTWGSAPTQQTIDTIFDTGSSSYWVYGPNATINSGSINLGGGGPCNEQPKPFFEWPLSRTYSARIDQGHTYAYGGNGKLVAAYYDLNDTMAFPGTDYPLLDTQQVAIANYTALKQLAQTCQGAEYDHSILGLYPPSTTDGPSFRDNLASFGLVADADIFSMWMDKIPQSVETPILGQAVFGCIAKDKYTGSLLELPNLRQSDQIGYYSAVPSVHAHGKELPQPKDGFFNAPNSCLVDSGSGTVALPVDSHSFFNTTGLIDNGYVAFPGKCDDIPHDAGFILQFEHDGEKVDINLKIRGFARFKDQQDANRCNLALTVGESDCLLGAPFFTGAFTAFNDAKKTISFAQGGVSKKSNRYSKPHCL